MRKLSPSTVVVGLAVVAERAGVLEQLIVAGDEHATLAGRDRLGRVKRIGARRRRSVPGRRPFQSAPWAWAQSSSRKMPSERQYSAIALGRRRPCGRRCGPARPPVACVRRPCARSPRATCRDRRGCSPRTPGRPPARDDRQRCGHEGVRRAQHGLARARRRSRARRARAPDQPARGHGAERRSRRPRPPRSGSSSHPRTSARRRRPRPTDRGAGEGRGDRTRSRTDCGRRRAWTRGRDQVLPGGRVGHGAAS